MYRRQTQPQAAPQAVGAYSAPRWIMPSVWSGGLLASSIVLIVICALAFFGSIWLISDGLQELIDATNQGNNLNYSESPNLLGMALLALVPAVVIGAIVWSIDRWEPEPAVVYVIALGWGAGVSVFLSLFGNEWWTKMIRGADFDERTTQILSVAVGAGVVEELTKGAGILLIFFVLNKYVNGPLDGIVLGLLVGVGFAFTENILYFGRASVMEGFYEYVQQEVPRGASISSFFIARALLTPFVHPLATAITGLFIGLASTQRKPAAFAFLFGLIGYGLAATLHALHNFSSIIGIADEPHERILLQTPVYVGAAVLIYTTARLQRRATLRGLIDYAVAGWVTRNEIAMVMSLPNRRRGRAWAGASVAERGGLAVDGNRAMKRFQRELIQLGYSRSVNVDRHTAHTQQARQQEAERLKLITSLREVFAEVQKATVASRQPIAVDYATPHRAYGAAPDPRLHWAHPAGQPNPGYPGSRGPYWGTR